ncbi:hypothetical protein FR483_n611R [Paramecium bursaria Chlorella virus FR483]|uniref:Uncharacterized protein n611R n=1 Tax=Paramecium bursaria Chlorella virus FR483 TaxID=399781 RepID=A7J7W5_PBCVF|nr:hypothetical protein FR483_n611R [Paramecium bursaria Chlorella virus FR483]ABT15896.1 hypothetical protein FR483_n611R [Paramecium bursaria Chlorella virus FR483]
MPLVNSRSSRVFVAFIISTHSFTVFSMPSLTMMNADLRVSGIIRLLLCPGLHSHRMFISASFFFCLLSIWSAVCSGVNGFPRKVDATARPTNITRRFPLSS